MPQIKWLGIIRDDPGIYLQGALPTHAARLEMPRSTAGLMGKAAAFLPLPFGLIFMAMFCKTFFGGRLPVSPVWVAVGTCVGLPGLLLHELLHALPYPGEAVVGIGIYPKALAAVALVSYPLSRGRFILMALLPAVLGVVPLLLFLVTPPGWLGLNGFLFGFGVMGLVSPYPDFYHVFQVLRQTRRGCQLQFVGDSLYAFD